MTPHRAGLARALSDSHDTEATEATEATEVAQLLDEIERHGRDGSALLSDSLSAKDRALLVYALVLTREPGSVTREHIGALRSAGCDDGEILDANQVTAYFAYANRVIDGLGVELEPKHLR